MVVEHYIQINSLNLDDKLTVNLIFEQARVSLFIDDKFPVNNEKWNYDFKDESNKLN